jgi:hypothetical protein
VEVPVKGVKPFSLFNLPVQSKLKEYFNDFLVYGGFPEVVLSNSSKDRIEYLKDIINSCIELDIKLLSDVSVSDTLYKIMRLLAARAGSKFDYTKLSGLLGINRNKVKDYLILLEYTYFITPVGPYTRNADRDIALQRKIYLSDNGLLTALGNSNSGSLLENAVANALRRKGTLNYYATRTGQEIDFILNENTAIEVKETAAPSDLNTLARRAESIGIKKHYLVSDKLMNPDFKQFVWAGTLDLS